MPQRSKLAGSWVPLARIQLLQLVQHLAGLREVVNGDVVAAMSGSRMQGTTTRLAPSRAPRWVAVLPATDALTCISAGPPAPSLPGPSTSARETKRTASRCCCAASRGTNSGCMDQTTAPPWRVTAAFSSSWLSRRNGPQPPEVPSRAAKCVSKCCACTYVCCPPAQASASSVASCSSCALLAATAAASRRRASSLW